MELKKIPTAINLNLTHDTDGLGISPEDAVDNFENFSDGFVHYVESASFTSKKQFDIFLKEVEEKLGKCKQFNYDTASSSYFKVRGPEFRCYGSSVEDEGITANWYTLTEENLHTTWLIYQKITSAGGKSVKITKLNFFISDGSLAYSGNELRKKSVDFIDKLYYPYIDTDLMFEQFFTGNENVLLLVGESGLGKSKLGTLSLKFLFEHPKMVLDDSKKDEEEYINVAYVKSNNILAMDEFWQKIAKSNVNLVIIDDLDYMLVKRSAEVQSHDDQLKNAFLNQFLSYTDGIEKHKTKFIITTNQPYDSIDKALLRKGRLFDILELRKLKNSEALNIWEHDDLDKEEFKDVFGDSDVILAADLGSEIAKRNNKKIKGKAVLPYLKENGISRLARAASEKKIGL